MNVSHILKDQRIHYGVGAALGTGFVFAYERWRKKKAVVVPPATPTEQRVIEARKHQPVVIDAETFAALTSETGTYDYTDPELERLLDEEEAIARREHEPVVTSVFRNPNNAWNYEHELATRDPEGPYIISYEEFIADDMGYRQETMTYYSKDDMMADPTDAPIYNYAGLMGELRFGHGSNDQNVVYIRNEKIHMEWEVLFDTGSFAEQVLGQHIEQEAENELRHSVQKFRGD